MLHKFFLSTLLIISLFACKKENTPEPEPPEELQNQGVDTLGTGWSKINVPAENYLDIFFTNRSQGYLISGLKIFKSINGGSTCVQAHTVSDTIVNIAAYGVDNAIFIAIGKLFVTNNGGLTLNSITLTDAQLFDAFFVSNTTAYAVGNKLWKTTDGGLTWVQTYDFGLNQINSSIYFLDETTGYVCGFDGIFKTTDGALTWNKVFSRGGGFISFPDLAHGYISSYNSILKTSNEGNTWTGINKPASQGLLDVHFATGYIGFISLGNEIYKTEDGGNSWDRVVKMRNTDYSLVELHFTDANHGWACGKNGTVLRYMK